MADTQRFRYSPITNMQGETLLRPLLPIILYYGDSSINVSALLDSGADVNVLPYHLGIQLGAIWERQPIVPSMSGNLAAYETRGLPVFGHVGHFEPVKLAFAWVKSETVPLILGQINFFSEFRICFLRSELMFEISLKS